MGVITPFMRLPTVNSRYEQIKQWIQISIEKAVFTPFLGAGASSLRPRTIDDASETPWWSVAQRLAALWNDLEDEEERLYLESVAQGHGMRIHKEAANNYTKDVLYSLQINLTKLGSLLTRLFGEQMTRKRVSASDPEDYAVRFGEEVEEERKEICNLALKAAEAARALAKSSPPAVLPSDCPPLRAEVIYRKLLVFCCRMCPLDDRSFCPERDSLCSQHREKIRSLRNEGVNLDRRDHLRLDELAWFDNLLWYTLRYHVPSYPTTGELAFQLLLMTDALLDFRMGPLAQVAELRANYEGQVREIRQWFQYCRGKHPPGKLHRAIAAALQYQFLRYIDSQQDRDPLPLAIAFTTNFDQTLEEAFEHLGFDYHVVFPVYVGWGEQPRPMWVWRSKKKRVGAMKWQQKDEECPNDRPDRIDGPIIVKLHGSPLDALPDPDHLGLPRDHRIQHFVVLSESSYLEAIVGEAWKYPQWIQDELRDSRRYLWFLGYSISDWNVRLRLFEHLAHSDELLLPRRGVFRLDVDRSFDPYKFAMLGALQVTVCEWDLVGLAEMMLERPEVERILECGE